jgi:hypothetical protein
MEDPKKKFRKRFNGPLEYDSKSIKSTSWPSSRYAVFSKAIPGKESFFSNTRGSPRLVEIITHSSLV